MVTGTYAYLTDTAEADNQIRPAENRIHIEEYYKPPENPGPGTVIHKAPKVVNDSNIPVYVRMLCSFSDYDAELLCEPLQIKQGWNLGADGYYYYTDALDPGEQTPPLFESVTIKNTISKEELIPFDIQIYAESIQTEDTTYDAAWKLY